MMFKLDALHVTPLLQVREGGVCNETVIDYTAAAKSGAKFPPLVAFKVSDRRFPGPVLVAGFHRLPALKAAGVDEYDVEIREGTFSEAWLAAYQSNLTNGMRYTRADKRKAAETALLLYRGDSAAAIAERINVSDEFIRNVRRELVAAGKIEQPQVVRGRDGGTSPATIKNKSDDCESSPIIGEDSQSSLNDEIECPVVESELVEVEDDEPQDYSSVDSLRGMAQEAADDHDYESAAAYRDEAEELEIELAKSGGKPIIRVPASRPSPFYRDGKPVVPPHHDPEHPYAKLLQQIVNLASAISALCNDESDDSKLRQYLLNMSFVFPRAKIVNGRHYGWKCVGLRGLYRAVQLAGLPGKAKNKDQLLKAVAEAMDPDGDKE